MGKIIQGIDLEDLIEFMERKNRTFQKHLLTGIEQVMSNPEEYKAVRKLVLDSMNNFMRSIVQVIYGEYERD